MIKTGYFAPSKGLLEDWQAKLITWPEYEERYRAQMDDPVIQRRIMAYAKRIESEQVHRFLCYERDPPCHRFILKAIIEEAFK